MGMILCRRGMRSPIPPAPPTLPGYSRVQAAALAVLGTAGEQGLADHELRRALSREYSIQVDPGVLLAGLAAKGLVQHGKPTWSPTHGEVPSSRWVLSATGLLLLHPTIS